MNNLSAVKYRQIEERAAEVAHYIVDNNATPEKMEMVEEAANIRRRRAR